MLTADEALLAAVITPSTDEQRPIHFQLATPEMWETPLHAAEEALIARAVRKRQREFRAGRHAAHALFEKLNIPCDALLTGVQREPAWPRGWVGSISHTQGFCAAAIAASDHYRGIGLDIEQARPLQADLVDSLCTRREQDRLQRLRWQFGNNFASALYETILFSAKECIHKVYFPLNQHTLDFLDAEIQIDPTRGTLRATIINPPSTPRHPITNLQGQFRVSANYIATFIAHAVTAN